MAEEKPKTDWHPAEIRRQDILDLLNNTKKLCTMYNDLMEIKKEGWERMLEGKRKAEEKRLKKGQNV